MGDTKWPVTVFCDDILQCRIFQRQVGIHPLESTVLGFQFLQSFDIRRLQPTVLRLLLVVCDEANAVFPPDLIDRATGIGFFENGHNLRFRET